MIKLFARTAACLLLTFASLSPALAQSDAALTFAWPVNVGALNPHLYSPNQMFAQNMVYEPLVRYRADGTVEPWLATKWTISDDGRTYTFSLRHDVTFSNGEPFTAEAAKANFDAVLANRSRHAWLELANQITQVDAVDRYTLRLHLKDSYYPTLQELSLPRPFRFIAPSQFVNGGTKDGIKAPIGTGPWLLTDSSLGEHDIFQRNPHYWGKAPAYDKIVVKVIPDPNTRAIALQTGEVDLVYGTDGPLSPDSFEQFVQSGEFTTGLSDPIETSDLALNSNRGPTRDKAVRLAINHAVDKDSMIKMVLHGTQKRADFLFAPTVPYADLHLTPYDYNPQKAAQILQADGWIAPNPGAVREKNGEKLVLDLCFVGVDAVAKAKAEIIQANLRAVGIETNLIGEEQSSIFARQRDGRFNMIFNGTWGAPYDPHAFVSSMRVPSHADYQAQRGLPDKALIDTEIGQVLTTSDEARRQSLYRDILTRLHDEAVYLPLTYTTIMAVAAPKVGSLHFGATASEIPFEEMTPKAP